MGNLNPYYNESFVFIVEQEQLRVMDWIGLDCTMCHGGHSADVAVTEVYIVHCTTKSWIKITSFK
jgi:hypothetical protein